MADVALGKIEPPMVHQIIDELIHVVIDPVLIRGEGVG